MTRILGVLGAVLIVLGAIGLFVQQRTPAPGSEPAVPSLDAAALAAPLPTDPAVTTGVYANGLRYYLRANPEPTRRAELRLVVNAGSILEDDDQRGVAHFVEHMAFNGTTHFPKQAIGQFMESIGMRFGPGVNATTSFDETTYALQIPTDRPEVIDRALLILEDWAHHVSFDADEVEKERGVVIEEWRQRRGAGARLSNLQLPVLLQGSRYADRLPIGSPDSIRGFTRDRIVQFYRDWYRPDLMAVVAVGDFDVAAIASRVRSRFGSIAAPASPRPRPVYAVPTLPGTRFAIATDPEATGTTITIRTRTPAEAQSTVGAYRQLVIDRLAIGMLSRRLAEVAERPGSPLLAANAVRGPFVRVADAVSFNAAVRDHAVDAGLLALATEAERVKRFGLTDGELDREKTLTLRALERVMTERETRPSAQLAAEYIRNFLVGEPFPGLEFEADVTRKLMPGITLAEVEAVARSWVAAGDRVVAVTAPERTGVTAPDGTRLAAIIRTAEGAAVAPYVFRSDDQPLLDALPDPGTIVRTTAKPEGITELELSNGVRVVLKPTPFKEDEVLFNAVSPGGTSLAADADLIPAVSAAQVVSTMGFGRFASADLQRALTGKIVTVRPVIGLYETTVAGGASARDLETLFQLIHLTFTEPRRDPVIFRSLQSSIRSAAAGQAASPELAFRKALAAALAQGHPRATVSLESAVDRMDLDRSLAFYRDRFADASGFTFVFVGSFAPDVIEPLIARYIASLPAAGRHETWRDVGIHAPPGVVRERVEKGSEAVGRAALVFTGPFSTSRASVATLACLANILQTRLRDTLREELSATYSVRVGSRATSVPRNEYAFSVEFGADPARLESLVTRVLGEIGRLKTDGPTSQEMSDVQTTLLRDAETQSRQNAWVLAQLSQRYQRHDDETTLDVSELIRGVTAAAVRDMARATLDTNRYVKVTLVPERR